MHRRNTVTSTESQDLYEAVYFAGRKENMKIVGRALSREFKVQESYFVDSSNIYFTIPTVFIPHYILFTKYQENTSRIFELTEILEAFYVDS